MKLIPCILLFAIVATAPKPREVSTLLGRGKIKLKQPHGVTWEKGKLYVVDSEQPPHLEGLISATFRCGKSRGTTFALLAHASHRSAMIWTRSG